MNATFTVTLYYDGQAVKQDTQTIHAQLAETQNNVEVHSAFTDTITYNGQTDCTAYRFHVTDGQYQFDSYGPC